MKGIIMTDASRWRFDLGRRIGMSYAANSKARVVMIAGSTGRGTADRYSDLEIDVYWSEPPTDAERRAAAEGTGGEALEIFAYEEDEWAEEISFGVFKVGTSTFLVETMERYVTRVVDEYSTDQLAQMRLSSVLHAQTLVGDDLVARWRAKAAAYPRQLAHAMVAEHLDFGYLGYAGQMLAARDDALRLYDLFVRVERGLLGALLGLNRIYLPEPSFKSMDELIGQMRLAPADLSSRLKRTFHLPPVEGVRELYGIIEETLHLIGTHLPDFDTTPHRAALQHPRGVWDQAPEV
jgi:hypothetical protein